MPLLTVKDLFHKIFVSLRYYLLKHDAKDLSRDLQQLEVRGILGSKLSIL